MPPEVSAQALLPPEVLQQPGAFDDLIPATPTYAPQTVTPESPFDFEPSPLERGLVSGASEMLGQGLRGFADLSEALYHRIPGTDPNATAIATRALADQLLKVPGVVTDPDTEHTFESKAGRFLGQAGAIAGEAAIDPAILMPQFFGQGYDAQSQAAQQYFDNQAAKNPTAPRDWAAEDATKLKAGMLGGALNSILALPFGEFLPAIRNVFGSAKAGDIASVLNKSYDTGGVGAVIDDLNVLRNSIAKSADPKYAQMLRF
jgi:hypothetical protein